MAVAPVSIAAAEKDKTLFPMLLVLVLITLI